MKVYLDSWVKLKDGFVGRVMSAHWRPSIRYSATSPTGERREFVEADVVKTGDRRDEVQ